jgi:hypothetical protein
MILSHIINVINTNFLSFSYVNMPKNILYQVKESSWSMKETYIIEKTIKQK